MPINISLTITIINDSERAILIPAEIDDNDVLVRQHHLCDNCIRKRMSDFMDRVRKSGKCSDCGKIITTNDDKEFWDVMGVCLDCFYSIKN